MKRIKFLSLLLLLALVFDMPVVNAGSSGGSGSGYVSSINIMYNVYNIPGQTWYTKLIDLTGYKGKNVSGTLEFELVPDNTASGTEKYNLEYEDYKGKTRNVNVTAVKHPGFQTFKYEVPFSSDDFVDPKFNQLCKDVKSDFGIIYSDLNSDIVLPNDRDSFPAGLLNSANDSWIKPNGRNNYGYYNEANLRNYIKLFNHAFMHEWGTATESPRMVKIGESPNQSDDMVIYHSTKASRSQFNTDEEYNNFLAYMDNNNLWPNWQNDPEKHVAAWECFRNLPNREMDYSYVAEPDKAIKNSRKNLLSKDKAFSEGKFSLFDHSFKMGAPFGANLVAITRPIAISKKYDASGNIVAIEKPLLPSVAQMDFESTNSLEVRKMLKPNPPVPPGPPARVAAGGPPVVIDDDDDFPGMDFDVKYHIIRYILKEKPSKGINLQIPDDEIIVDFIYHEKNPLGFMYPICYVNIYKDRASADAYRYRFPKRYKKIFNQDGSTRFEYSRYTSTEFCHEITDSVQVKNKYIPTITPTPTVPTTPNSPQSYPRTGDSENVWVYVALLMLSIAMVVFIRKKRYSNK